MTIDTPQAWHHRLRKFFRKWYILLVSLAVITILPLYLFWPAEWQTYAKADFAPPHRSHLDHSVFFADRTFASPQEVTKACMSCHKNAAEDLRHSSHWTWLSEKAVKNQSGETVTVGKKNLMNNFCISTVGNEKGCTSCHAGYGWEDKNFDFNNLENMDCLVCHDGSGTYAKGPGGWPQKSVNLQLVAKSVTYPKRENCGACHFSGGGGMGVKHGDLDGTLVNAPEAVDVHMGKHEFLCIDCHKTESHQTAGKINMTALTDSVKGRVSCTQCHSSTPHADARLNQHTAAIACQTCHIPQFAKRIPTKMYWDWSKAGDPNRKEEDHSYLKIKGEFKYDSNVLPEYGWFNLKMDRYLTGDALAPEGQPTPINLPQGSIDDPNAKIWPFKIHRAVQPYDKTTNILIPPVTAGKGGYWTSFDWDQSLSLGAQASNLPYSGNYGFTNTVMYWPLNHMVSPKQDSLRCNDCHSSTGESRRFDWQKLGYKGDPIQVGGRRLIEGAQP